MNSTCINPNPFPTTPRLDLILGAVQDPQARRALLFNEGLLPEPILDLHALQQALSILRPGGRAPCSRTIQRWVKERGMPCATDPINGRRFYFLSKVFAWWHATFRTTSIAEEASAAARSNLERSRRPKFRASPITFLERSG